MIFDDNALTCGCADVVNPDHIHLKRGDKVKVDVDSDTFKKVQKEHQSGWNDGMKQVPFTCKHREQVTHTDTQTVIQVVLTLAFTPWRR